MKIDQNSSHCPKRTKKTVLMSFSREGFKWDSGPHFCVVVFNIVVSFICVIASDEASGETTELANDSFHRVVVKCKK